MGDARTDAVPHPTSSTAAPTRTAAPGAGGHAVDCGLWWHAARALLPRRHTVRHLHRPAAEERQRLPGSTKIAGARYCAAGLDKAALKENTQ